MALPLRPRPGPGVPYDIVPRILRAPEKLGLALRSETVRRIVFGHGAQLLRGILAGAEAAQKIIRPLAVLRPHIIHRSMARQSDFTIATDSPFAGAAKHERPCRTHEIRPVDAKLRLPHKPHRRRKRQDPFAEPEIRLPSVIAEREAAAILPQYLKRRIRLCDGVRGAGLLDRVRMKAEYDARRAAARPVVAKMEHISTPRGYDAWLSNIATVSEFAAQYKENIPAPKEPCDGAALRPRADMGLRSWGGECNGSAIGGLA